MYADTTVDYIYENTTIQAKKKCFYTYTLRFSYLNPSASPSMRGIDL